MWSRLQFRKLEHCGTSRAGSAKGGSMKSRLIEIAILAGLLAPVIYSQEGKSGKPASEAKPAAPATMKLYEVPPAREANSQPPEEVADYFKITQTQGHKERVRPIW